MTRTFNTAPAQRAQVNMIVGLVGPSSSGKTWTALELATGMQAVTGGDIEMIDTEHGRGLFYAENFRFNHTPFEAPFASLDYLAAIQAASKRAKIIIVDSMSHEHEGVGGMIDWQERELHRMAGGDKAAEDNPQEYERKLRSNAMLAWAKPKAARRKLLQGLTQIDAHVILCFRAKNTSKPGKEKFRFADGREGEKNVVIPMGFVPIAGEEFVFEAALSALLPPNSKGVPNWDPEMPGEKIAVKLPSQFAWLAGKAGPLSRQDGQRLAEWARGSSPQPTAPQAPRFVATDATPPLIDHGAASDWAHRFELEIDEATDAARLEPYVRAAFGSPEWAALKAHDAPRATTLGTKANATVKALKKATVAA